ncbi:putative checkpoint protein Rad17/Rad24 [Lupinus albus]|uniref:Putative checkpoint protein Rad17/Rad24 n=1 Tax=Lupinus albus TaxID=3870 RepID=A0A6A4NKV6_LUPAL|nr:putative checkpoint protein Rad17/Rad24 [Lupinus albus]
MMAPDLNPCNDVTPPRRSTRRRLVQSTLFPHKPSEAPEANEKDDKEHEYDDDYYITKKNHKKRKSKPAKTTPPKKPSKSKQNCSPKKNGSINSVRESTLQQMLADSVQADTYVPDLRLEAKISAEENSRMYAGREMHPLFAPRKVNKRVQDVAESGSNFYTAESGVERITCGPIHVFENIQDDTSFLDWREWTFLGKTTYVNCGPESSNSSVLEGSVESLNFDKLNSPLYPVGASVSQTALPSSDQLSTQPENLQEIPPSNSTLQANEQTDLEVDISATFSGQVGVFRKSDAKPLSRFLQESMRSYYHSEGKAKDCLWTHKYKPTKAIEVCGNDEAVNILRDWLHQWHEKRYQSRKKSSIGDKIDIQDDDDDYICSRSDYDSEDNNEEDSLQNVLLITGPIGSGKSAAVYACAEEQGFEILELNASDCRNGIAVKQYFGDTLGSHGFKRLSEHNTSSQNKTTKLSPSLTLPNGKTADKMDDGVVELITVSDDEAHSPCGTSQKLLGKNNVFACDKVQTLILVEEIDILFPEDRGCIAAIQQIAETARGPIILTSNSDNHGLSDSFDRLHVSFSLPSPKELLCHLYKVCVTEGVNAHPLLLEKFIQSCDGDIRKTIMHLQFWFQSERFRKDGKAQTIYGSLPFDLEVAHQILPKIMPWDFPSELSEKIENEIAKSISIMEESSSLQGLVKEELQIHERVNDLDEQFGKTDYIEAMKMEMIKRNGSITDYSEFEIQYNAISEFSNCSGSPQASSKQHGRRKLVVMSSDSEDEGPNNGHPFDKARKRQSLEDNNESSSKIKLSENYSRTSFHKMVCSELEDSEEEHFKFSETVDDTCLSEICKSFDISCVPESTFVPETVIENEIETMSEGVSSGHLVGLPEVSTNEELIPTTFSGRKRLKKMAQNSDLLMNTEIPGSFPKDVQYFLDEKMETKIANVMDECSCVGFTLNSNFVASIPSMETDIVQKLWKELRDCRMDLRQHANSEEPGAIQLFKLADGLSNLISEADLLHNHQHTLCDIMESPMFLSDEVTSSGYDEQMMMSTFAEHGFCFYAKQIADMRLKLDHENKFDLTSEMLASTANVMALGKLSRQDLNKITNIYTEKQLEMNNPINHMQKSENRTSLSNVIQSIVPARISLSLKDVPINEYLSSLRRISRSEASRISESVQMKRRGRVRGFQHYLSRCTMLSPEDISFVSESDLYRNNSSQCPAKVESNHA